MECITPRFLLYCVFAGALPLTDILGNASSGNQQATVYASKAQDPTGSSPQVERSVTSIKPRQTATPITTTSPDQTIGQVYHVSPDGSDADAGTASAPWRSIQAAAHRLQAGDIAIVMDGTYEEDEVLFANSGTAANPITIKSQNKWGAVLSSISGGGTLLQIARGRTSEGPYPLPMNSTIINNTFQTSDSPMSQGKEQGWTPLRTSSLLFYRNQR
ncbi:MAG: hypothetical protein M3Z35_11065 [Nitrospirota bacterium]|nr:hypothetical protein [Nitrospirota bacterium]